MKAEWGLSRVWKKSFQCITFYCTRRSLACLWSWKKLILIQTNMCIFQSGASTPQQILHPVSQSRGFWLALNLPDTHAYIYTHRDEHVITPCIHIFFSLSSSHTNTHARAGNQPASRFDTLPVLWSGQRRDGFSHHRLWSLCEEEVVCVYMIWGKGGTDINSL